MMKDVDPYYNFYGPGAPPLSGAHRIPHDAKGDKTKAYGWWYGGGDDGPRGPPRPPPRDMYHWRGPPPNWRGGWGDFEWHSGKDSSNWYKGEFRDWWDKHVPQDVNNKISTLVTDELKKVKD